MPNPKKKLPADVRSLARSFTHMAIDRIAGLAVNGEPDAVQLAACIALLDRGWGKPDTNLNTNVDGEFRVIIRNLIEEARAPKVIDHE